MTTTHSPRARLAATLLALSGLAGAAQAADGHDHAHAHTPLQGGVLVEAADLDFELVAQSAPVRLHVRDHGRPLALQGASARLTVLSGADKRELQLQPVGDRLEAGAGSARLAPGSKVIAQVTLPGRKPVQVRFVVR